jgi:hypothetical protein
LEPGDIEEAMKCAIAIGDDRLQQQAQGYVRPESSRTARRNSELNGFAKGMKRGTFGQATHSKCRTTSFRTRLSITLRCSATFMRPARLSTAVAGPVEPTCPHPVRSDCRSGKLA